MYLVMSCGCIECSTSSVGELNMDPITVGNWIRNSQGALWFIKVGKGVLDGLAQDNDRAMEDNQNDGDLQV